MSYSAQFFTAHDKPFIFLYILPYILPQDNDDEFYHYPFFEFVRRFCRSVLIGPLSKLQHFPNFA